MGVETGTLTDGRTGASVSVTVTYSDGNRRLTLVEWQNLSDVPVMVIVRKAAGDRELSRVLAPREVGSTSGGLGGWTIEGTEIELRGRA